jgi:hypothetical protein
MSSVKVRSEVDTNSQPHITENDVTVTQLACHSTPNGDHGPL